MVLIYLYDEKQEVEQIPENFLDFKPIIGILFNLETVDNLVMEYTHNNKDYNLLNNETYNNFFLSGTKDSSVFVYSSIEETNYFKNKKEQDSQKEDIKIEEKEDAKIEEKEDIKMEEKEDIKMEEKEDIKMEEKEEEEEINNENNNKINNDDKEIKIPEITKDMVIASIVRQVKENMQKSRILQQKKQKEEEEERKRKENEKKEKEKGISDQINNLITNRLDNLKEELINESQIKFSQIMSESQINLKNAFEKNNDIVEENSNFIHSLERHPGFSCNNCGIDPIVGNRYCCVYCNNINFCEKCEEKEGLRHGHPLYKFKLRIE